MRKPDLLFSVSARTSGTSWRIRISWCPRNSRVSGSPWPTRAPRTQWSAWTAGNARCAWTASM